jgi:hypothetical protein
MYETIEGSDALKKERDKYITKPTPVDVDIANGVSMVRDFAVKATIIINRV